MKKTLKSSLALLAATVVAFSISGCTAMQETMASQMEVPTLEKQVNRVAIGMSILRQNNIMAFKMPISSDSNWPSLVAADLTYTQKKSLEIKIMADPYFSTYKYTDPIQREALGSGTLMNMLGSNGNSIASVIDSAISPMAYRAVQKIEIFYGKDPTNWPSVFDFDASLDDFLDFKGAKLRKIESPTGDIHNTLDEAMIALTPINFQKDLNLARIEMLSSFEDTAKLSIEKGSLEAALEADEIKVKNKTRNYSPMTNEEKLDKKREINILTTRINEAKSLASEKELIYFELIDQAVIALESELNLDDENYVKLAKNLHTVAEQVQVGAVEAGASFGLSLTSILANDIIANFPIEVESLNQAAKSIPPYLQTNYKKRKKRLLKNAIYLLPNITIGTYYATKQASVAGKYKGVTEIILAAHKTKQEQEAQERIFTSK